MSGGQWAGALLLGVMAVMLAIGPLVWTSNPDSQNLLAILQSPSATHPLGTDQFGRDVLARLLHGGRISVASAVAIVAASLAAGCLVGLFAAGEHWPARAITHATDILLALPSLIMTLAIVGALGAGMGHLVLAFTAVGWPHYARLTRGLARARLTDLDVGVARTIGVPTPRLLATHVWPHVLRSLAVAATLDIGYTLGGLAAFSYLGLGAAAPQAEWGLMLRDSQSYFTVAPWLLAAPAAAIAGVVTGALLLVERLASDGAAG
jgi:ABC-type dipeptide/oligopeptide/nickel transport system permease subunit